jgi:hypothetical protein
VCARDRAALLPGQRRHVHDPSPAALAHPRADQLAGQEDAAQVGGEHVVPLLDRDLPQRAADRPRRVVDEHVDRAERALRLLDQPLDRGGVAQVGADDVGRAVQLARHPPRAVLVDVGEHHVRAPRRERARDRLAQALRRTGDDRGPPLHAPEPTPSLIKYSLGCPR